MDQLLVGASAADARRHLGDSVSVELRPGGSRSALLRPGDGIRVILGLAGAVEAVDLLRPEADSSVERGSSARTPEGLGLDSSPLDFLERWGPPDERRVSPSPFYEDGELWRYRARGVALLVASAPGHPARLMGLRVEAPVGQP